MNKEDPNETPDWLARVIENNKKEDAMLKAKREQEHNQLKAKSI